MCLQIAGLRAGEVDRRLLAEEHRQQPRSRDDLHGVVAGGLAQAVRQMLRRRGEARVRSLVQQLQRRQSSRHRHRVAGQRPRLIDVAGWGEHPHQLGAAADRRCGQSAADHLAEDREVGEDARQLLRAAARDPESADHLVEHEQRPVGVGALAQQLEKAVARRYETHVRRQRLGDDRGELVALARRDQRLGIVPRQHDRARAAALAGTPGLAGSAWVARPEPDSASSPSTCPW